MQGFSGFGFDKWRCMCGQEHGHEHIFCWSCGKRRWKQLGLTYVEARSFVKQLYAVIAERVA